MKFDQVNRRLHLYLALSLLPWFVMFGASSLVIHHRSWFQAADATEQQWTELVRRDYSREIADDADLQQIGAAILADVGLAGPFQVRRPDPDRVEINRHDSWAQTRVAYQIQSGQLTVSKRNFPKDELLVRMHVRTGFGGPLSHDLWAVVVDIVCLGFLTWALSGLYMWWKIKRTRKWGLAALAAGTVSFAWFLWAF